MGRPQKQTVDYFPHFANSGKTMFILESKFGNNGYAFWFKLLEILAITEGHYFRVENSIDWEFLLAKTKVSGETATEILNTLASLDSIDKELWDKKIIWVQKFVDNLGEVYRKRKVSAPIKPFNEDFRDGNPSIDVVSDDINPQRRVEESKVKESKGEKIEKDKSLSSNTPTIEICKYYEQAGFGTINHITMQKLEALIEMYSKEWVKDAIDTAVLNGKYKLTYVDGILQNWKSEGKNPKQKNQQATTYKNKKSSNFNNFDQRTYEEVGGIDKIAEQLQEKQSPQGEKIDDFTEYLRKQREVIN